MSSKFISNTSIDQSLQNGTAFLNIKNIKVQDLQPNFPVKADEDKNIYSTKLSTSDITGLENVLTNPFDGTLEVKNLTTAYDTTPLDLNIFIQNTLNGLTDLDDATQNQSATPNQTTFAGDVITDNVKCDFLQDKTGSSLIEMGSTQINLNATEIDLVATSVKINGQPVIYASVDLQDAYNNSVVAETQLATTKPYIIKAVDTAEIVNIDGDTKEVNITGDLLVNGSNLESQITNIEGEITNLQNDKYDKTGGVLTGDLIHNGNNVQLQGLGAVQIQNQGTVQIQPTGALIMKAHGVLGEINMSNNKIINVATPTDPFDASTKLYVDNAVSGIPPTDLTDLETKTQNISLAKTNATQTFMNQNLVLGTEGGQIISGISGQGLDTPITDVSPLLVGTNGFVFTVSQDVVMTRVKVKEELFNTSPASNVSIELWNYRESPPSWLFTVSVSLSFGDVGNEDGYRWTINGMPRQLLAGTRYAITYNMGLGQELSDPIQSPITIGSVVNIQGSVYRNVGQPNTFPENETTDGYAPVGSFDYVSADEFNKS